MFQVVARCSNKSTYVLGEITKKEAENAKIDDPTISCQGIYLVAIDNEKPTEPGTVLAKFVSEDAARHLAQFFRAHGLLEA